MVPKQLAFTLLCSAVPVTRKETYNFALMAFSCALQTAAVPSPPPPPLAGKASPTTNPNELRLALKGFEARTKIEQPKPVSSLSRRDAVCLASVALLGNLIASDAAEARRIKPETRQKIREKLEKLREKAGVTKERTDSNSGSKEQELPKSSLNSLSVPLTEATV